MYVQKRREWLSRLSGPGFQAANRPVEQHVSFQQYLQELGYLPAAERIDGVYGPATRAAIAAWERSKGLPESGFLSDADARSFEQQVSLTRNLPNRDNPQVSSVQILIDRQVQIGVDAYTAGDYTSAFNKLWPLRDSRSAKALYYLGVMAHLGRGMSQDYALAMNFYKRSMELDYPPAYFGIGVLYANGRGVPKNLEETLLWYQRAAERGHGLAQYNLGLAYLAGLGTPKDYREGLFWMLIAGPRIDDPKVTEAINHNISIAEARLESSTVESARRDATSWKPKEVYQIAHAANAPASAASGPPSTPSSTTAPTPVPTTAQGPPPETPGNRPLLHGDDDDTLVLLNVGPAARIALNVRGDPVFPTGSLQICLLSEKKLSFDVVAAVDDRLSKFRPQADISGSPACATDSLDRADIVVTTRDALKHLDRSALNRLIADFEGRKLDLQIIIYASDLKEAQDHRAELAEQNNVRLSGPTQIGWGALIIANADTSRICAAEPTGVIPQAAIGASRRTFALEAKQRLDSDIRWGMDVDAAFIAARRGACRVVLAQAPDLAQIARALERDKIPYALSSEWIEKETPTPKNVPSLALTEANRWLLAGSPNDFLVLIQVGPTAPNATVNLEGNVVFLGGEATICKTSAIEDLDLLHELDLFINEYKLRTQIDNVQACNKLSLSSYDIAVGYRRDFINSSNQIIEWLVRQYQHKDIILSLFSAESAEQRQQKRKVDRAINTRHISDPAEQGWGFLTFKNESSVLCAIATDEFPKELVLTPSLLRKLSIDTGTREISISMFSADNAFIEARRRACRTIFGEAPALKKLTEAFERDQIEYRVSFIWVSDADIAEAKKQAAQREREDAIKAQQESEKLDQMRKEAEQRSRLAGEERKQETERLQRDNRSTARSAQEQLTNVVKKLLNRTTVTPDDLNRTTVTPDDQQELNLIRNNFPEFTQTILKRWQSGWTLDGLNADIYDYGNSEYNSRVLDAIFVRFDIKLKNADVGKYENVCYVLGWQVDKEFSRVREPLEVQCGDIDRYTPTWNLRHQFLSKWKAA
jgi:hypothetical protein